VFCNRVLYIRQKAINISTKKLDTSEKEFCVVLCKRERKTEINIYMKEPDTSAKETYLDGSHDLSEALGSFKFCVV